MELDVSKVVQDCLNAINKEISNLKTLNIIVIGKSGVGKSTLINSVFRGNFTETGLGRPITQKIRKIEKNGYPLAIYDTPGFELSSSQQEAIKKEILSIINRGYNSNDINETIHCIWYYINVASNRTFDSSEIKWLEEFLRNENNRRVPIIVILTQGIPKNQALEMKALVEKENLDIAKVVPVLAQPKDFDGEYTAPAYGLDSLIAVMGEILPDELQKTLQNIQKVNLEEKKKKAYAAVATAATASFAEGAAPIPFSDAFLLVPTQVSMIAAITAIFGIEVNKSILTAIVSSTLGAGGAISAGTATLLTTALGNAYISIMEMIFKGELKKEDLSSKEGKNLMTNLFKKQLEGSK
ncbi:GTPase [uncultured Fusobacterium sp.]|uniref:GTPase family protein n=1 Tax=uncultured Fusobacterium sp. TaxID=159267 RepID=UPI0026169B83|nr:GTPase [uncultured Fusobacterium sp.]